MVISCAKSLRNQMNFDINDKDYYTFQCKINDTSPRYCGNKTYNIAYVYDTSNVKTTITIPENKKGLHFCGFKENQPIEIWMVDDKLHRNDKPALMLWQNQKVIVRCYYKTNKVHRLEGPAYIDYRLTHKTHKQYFVNNKKIDLDRGVEFPVFNGDKIVNDMPLNSATIMNAMLFDREYGKFLRTIHRFFKLNRRQQSIVLNPIDEQANLLK